MVSDFLFVVDWYGLVAGAMTAALNNGAELLGAIHIGRCRTVIPSQQTDCQLSDACRKMR
eukprot:scaffold29371_cov79-Cyclotella_meneghiniana.AAC.4